MLRDYQQAVHEKAIVHLRKSLQPIVVTEATGAGKSHNIAALATELRRITPGKRVLVIAPSKELVEQDCAKYIATGNPASIFSASAGSKCLRHPVVFGSPVSIKNSLDTFVRIPWSLVVLDECHGITPTIRGVINSLRTHNPQIRVVGFTATPYRLGTGYIYRHTATDKALGEDAAREPYFHACVAEVPAHVLIERGYLTRPVIGATGDGYDTSKLKLNRRNQFDAEDVDEAFVGHGRLTSRIVGEVVEKSKDAQGVMFFAATVAHAEEILASLPEHNSAIVTAKTKTKARSDILSGFLSRKLKYLVNVACFTTGFDAPHVDVIAILRRTESVGLLQQICGRGLRVSAGKSECLILDYAGNISTHCPDGDLFNPTIKAAAAPTDGEPIDVTCPDCGTVNEFRHVKELLDMKHDKHGYVLDLAGNRVETEHGPMPCHHGRRCFGEIHGERCNYRWTSKDCPVCETANDITARRCAACKAEMIDPNEKLIAEYQERKKDPTKKQTDRVISIRTRRFTARSGQRCLEAACVTSGHAFSLYFHPESKNKWAQVAWKKFKDGFDNPRTITYQKKKNGYFSLIAFNRPEDQPPGLAQ